MTRADLLQQINREVIDQTMALFPAKFDSVKARVMLLAIGLQESRFEHRRQVGGPARGFWQFELGGGVRGVMTHEASRAHANRICRRRGVPSGVPGSVAAAYRGLEKDDILACSFARLLLWTDPKPLPNVGAVNEAWDCYIRNWRPGKPHRGTWNDLYADAMAVFKEPTA